MLNNMIKKIKDKNKNSPLIIRHKSLKKKSQTNNKTILVIKFIKANTH